MKFKPLEFVTNTFAAPSGNDAATATTRRSSRRSPRNDNNDKDDNDDNDDSDDDSSLSASPSNSHKVRFDVPSSDSEPEIEPSANSDSQFFVLRKDFRSNRTTSRNENVNTTTSTASPPKTTGNEVEQDSSPTTGNTNTATAKTPSPGKTAAKKISPQGAAPSLKTPQNAKSTAITPSGQKARKQSNKPNTPSENESNATTIPQTAEKEAQPPRKKRLTVYEHLIQDTSAAADQWKEDTDEALRFKKKIHKEKIKEIRDTQDQMKELQQRLDKLKSAANDLETQIQKEVETKKRALKLGNNLRKTAARATKKALKDKDDAKANLKAKDTLLKEAKKDMKKELQNQKRGRAEVDSDSDSDDEVVQKKRKKKKRKVSPASKKQTNVESSEDEDRDSDASDSDDSDWERAPKENKKKGKKRASGVDEDTTGESPTRRQTRIRSSKWTCSRCTLENEMEDHECAACGESRPGHIPDF